MHIDIFPASGKMPRTQTSLEEEIQFTGGLELRVEL
jgi:hypothetical protein